MALIVMFLVGFGLGMFIALMVWDDARRRVQKQEEECAVLDMRVVGLEKEVAQAQQEAELQQELADRRRAKLSEAEAQLARVQSGFEALQRREAEVTSHAQTDAQLFLFERLASLLVQLPTVQHAAAEGADISAQDVLALVAPLNQAMADMGFAPIGAPGEEVSFDPRLHQGKTGLAERQTVQIKFVGYQHGDQILRRAQVTTE